MIGCSNRTDRDKRGSVFSDCQQSLVSEEIKHTNKDLNLEKLQYIRVCSDHFVHGSPAKLYDSTNPDWVPSLKLGYDTSSTQKATERYVRVAERNSRRRPAPTNSDGDGDSDHGFVGTPVQTELTAKEVLLLQEEVVL